MLNKKILEIIACTMCKKKLDLVNEELHCDYCNINFKIWNDIPIMVDENTSFDPDKIPPSIKYHLRELETSQDAINDRHLNPYFKNNHKTILDIGCGIGQSFVGTGIYNDHTRKLFPIDIDIRSLNYGKSHYDNINFINSSGDDLPIISN